MGDVTPLQIGPFAIIRLLRDSPFESVYLGKQQGRAKNYSTIHVFHTPLATDEEREAFLTRAKSLKKLKHRNIAETLDYGLLPDDKQSATRGYLVTQYISEKNILERFPQGQLGMPDEIKRALSPIADALQYAHASHIYHHHLHPGSILIDESKQFLLTGFSPLLPYSNDPDALPYMAPEALQGNPGPASDPYAADARRPRRGSGGRRPARRPRHRWRWPAGRPRLWRAGAPGPGGRAPAGRRPDRSCGSLPARYVASPTPSQRAIQTASGWRSNVTI